MSASVHKTVAFTAEVHAGLMALVETLNIDRTGPKITFNFLVNQACRAFVERATTAQEASE